MHAGRACKGQAIPLSAQSGNRISGFTVRNGSIQNAKFSQFKMNIWDWKVQHSETLENAPFGIIRRRIFISSATAVDDKGTWAPSIEWCLRRHRFYQGGNPMCRYKHLTLEDREGIMVMYIDGKSIADIADAIDRDKSTVSREVRRSAQGPSSKRSGYRAWRAQSDLCQDFGHASSKNQAARGISSGLGAVCPKRRYRSRYLTQGRKPKESFPIHPPGNHRERHDCLEVRLRNIRGKSFYRLASAWYPSPHSHMASMMGRRLRPRSVRAYSTCGGTSG